MINSAWTNMQFADVIDGNSIEVWSSAFSGMEKIWLNGELISKKRSFRLRTKHSITLNSKPVIATLRVGILPSNFTCEISDDQGNSQMVTPKSQRKPYLLAFTFGALIGGVITAWVL